MRGRKEICRILSFIIVAVMVIGIFPSEMQVQAAAPKRFTDVKIDFGGEGVEPGYVGVTDQDKYDDSKGYGFNDIRTAKNVKASGTGVYSDAVMFNYQDANHIFNVNLENGLYRITVTTGDVTSLCINAEGVTQISYLTGNCTSESFIVPITDYQLNIYATAGYPKTEWSLSAMEIERLSADTTMPSTIYLFGDSTVANYYNIPDSASHGWGQVLHKYIDSKYYVHNLSASGWTSSDMLRNEYINAAVKFGSSNDIAIIALGINDYTQSNGAGSGTYVSNLSSMVSQLKDKGIKVYLVKQPWSEQDLMKYPVPDKMWFSDEIDQVAAKYGANVIDLFTPWREFCMTVVNPKSYYSSGVHQNATGAEVLARMVADQLFPTTTPGAGETTVTKPYDAAGTIIYKTEASGEVITNPHKGFVMNVYEPRLFDSSNPRGIGGSLNNKAWDVVTICSGVYFWKDLNPKKGVYDWSAIDAMLDACQAHGMTYGLRVQPYTTGKGSHENYGAEHDFVPQWVYDSGVKHVDVKYTDENGKTWPLKVPDWSSEYYIKAYKDFITALAAHYDGDPRLEYVEIRAFGNYGEWHTSGLVGSEMPSEEIQNDMLDHYVKVFKKTTCCLLGNPTDAVYNHAIEIGLAKRNNGLIMTPREEWILVPAYKANLMTMGDYHHSYQYMLTKHGNYDTWTPERFQQVIETAHLSVFSLDMDSTFGYEIYRDQKAIVDKMVNELGYNFTVTSARKDGNKLQVMIENTGLAPAFFDFNLCADITDANGNKIGSFGNPILIGKGTFHDGEKKTFVFEYNGTMPKDAKLCLGMYECNNKYVDSSNPNIRFDNKNNLPNKRLLLVQDYVIGGIVEPTATPKPTATSTPKPTATTKPTATPKPTSTPTLTTIPTETSVPSLAPTIAPEVSPVVVPTITPVTEPTASPVPDVTEVPKPTATVAPTVVPTTIVTPTATPTTIASPVPTATTTPKPTATSKPVANPATDPTTDPTKAPSVEDFAERLYTTCLGRDSEEEGKAYWIAELKAGKPGSEVAEGFFFSPEFVNNEFDNGEFITRLYRTFMGREPDLDGIDYWNEMMKQGYDRKFVFDGFVNSTEWADICLTYGIRSGGLASPTFEKEASEEVLAFAERLYTTCLGREAEKEGLEWWAAELANLRQTGTVAAQGFFYSPEFVGLKTSDDEYVTRLYRTFMGREPEKAGFKFWTDELKGGKDRQYVFDGFSVAPEFADLCAEAGIMR